MNVVVVVSDAVVAQPFAQAFLEKLFVEILAPQGAEADAGLVQAAVQVEHTDQARPLARPVGHCEDGSAMAEQSGEHMIAVLPHGLGNHQGRLGMDMGENVHAHALVVDEAVAQGGVKRVRALERESFGLERGNEFFFHLRLGGPALLVGRLAKVSAGDQQDLFGGDAGWCFEFGNRIGCHSTCSFSAVLRNGRG